MEIYQVDPELVKEIPWEGSVELYDTELYNLGPYNEIFAVVNPWLHDSRPFYFIEDLPEVDQCVVYTHKGEWVAKFFPVDWNFNKGYYTLEIEIPKMVWRKNPDLDRSMTFDNDPINNFLPDPYQSKCELVWYIDKRFAPIKDRVWAYKCRPLKGEVLESRDMGDICPNIEIIFNDELPDFSLKLDKLLPPFWECENENVYLLDPIHTPHEEKWVVRIRPKYRKSKDWVVKGYISPQPKITYNSKLPRLEYEIDLAIPHYDFEYEHVYLLDPKYTPDLDYEIWAFKMSFTKTKGSKVVGYISPNYRIIYSDAVEDFSFRNVTTEIPYYDFAYTNSYLLDPKLTGNEDVEALRIEYALNPSGYKSLGYISPDTIINTNKAIKNLCIEWDYQIPYHDKDYLHEWYVDYHGEKIWVVRAKLSKKSKKVKDMGMIDLTMATRLDIIFISYHEQDAELNWKRVKAKAPWAKRVDGVTGIFQAHKRAAEIAETDMFYVVDGDAWLVDDWTFDFSPDLFDRQFVYIWLSRNPINDLVYGYGGVKLFPRQALLKMRMWQSLDLSTSVVPGVKVMDSVSNITRFNTDEFSTWRSVFRECVKLALNEQFSELEVWRTQGSQNQFGNFANQAAQHALDFIKEETDHKLINDRSWLAEKFKSLYNIDKENL